MGFAATKALHYTCTVVNLGSVTLIVHLMNTSDKGSITEAIILAEFTKRGYTVFVPWGQKAKFDLIVHMNDKLLRVECKTGRINNGCVCFSAVGSDYKKKSFTYKGIADYIAVYCMDNSKVYFVPVEDCSERPTLRLTSPRNNQKVGVKWAKDYEL